jgi:CBS domain-containing protein
VTDRDIVVRGVARDYPSGARIDSVMSQGVVALDAEADLRDAAAAFRRHGIRRLPLMDGRFPVGMLTTDDLIVDMARQLGEVAGPIAEQVVHGQPVPRLPATAV